jgi:hypothetical protein
LFPSEYLHLDNPAQFIRVYFVGIAPGKRNLFQLIGVGYDDIFHPVPEQPGKRKGGNGSLNENIGVHRQGFEKLSQPNAIEIKGFNPFVFRTVHRRLLIPVTTGKPVSMQVDTDKVH